MKNDLQICNAVLHLINDQFCVNFLLSPRYRIVPFCSFVLFPCIRITNFSITIYGKNYPFSSELPLYLCQNSIDHTCVGLDYLDLTILFH